LSKEALEKQKFGLSQQEYETKKAGGYFKKYPPAGRAPSLIDLMTPQQREQYAARTASGAPTQPVIPSASQRVQLEVLKSQAQKSNGLFGYGKHEADPQAIARYNAYAPKYGLAPLGPDGVPFKNQSKAKINNVSKSVAEQNGVHF
jgi:hypothetical protein